MLAEIWFASVAGVPALCTVLFLSCLTTIADELQIHRIKTIKTWTNIPGKSLPIISIFLNIEISESERVMLLSTVVF